MSLVSRANRSACGTTKYDAAAGLLREPREEVADGTAVDVERRRKRFRPLPVAAERRHGLTANGGRILRGDEALAAFGRVRCALCGEDYAAVANADVEAGPLAIETHDELRADIADRADRRLSR